MSKISGLATISLNIHGDDRGFFVERFHSERFRALGLPTTFPQLNHSRSAPGILRGLHYQHAPAQGKLVGVTRGRIWDVAVDLRPGSATFGQHEALELSDINGKLLWIPPGFAHGFCVLGEEPADLLYMVTEFYNPKGEGGLHWADPDLKIRWPIQSPKVSERDSKLPPFASYRASPPRWPVAR